MTEAEADHVVSLHGVRLYRFVRYCAQEEPGWRAGGLEEIGRWGIGGTSVTLSTTAYDKFTYPE